MSIIFYYFNIEFFANFKIFNIFLTLRINKNISLLLVCPLEIFETKKFLEFDYYFKRIYSYEYQDYKKCNN